MLILNRRDFIKNATVFGALAATGIARGASNEVGKPYPGWGIGGDRPRLVSCYVAEMVVLLRFP